MRGRAVPSTRLASLTALSGLAVSSLPVYLLACVPARPGRGYSVENYGKPAHRDRTFNHGGRDGTMITGWRVYLSFGETISTPIFSLSPSWLSSASSSSFTSLATSTVVCLSQNYLHHHLIFTQDCCSFTKHLMSFLRLKRSQHDVVVILFNRVTLQTVSV